MKNSFILFLAITSPLCWPDIIRSPIHSLDSNATMIRFENGRVAFIDSTEKLLAAQLNEAALRKDLVEVKVDDKQELISIQTIEEKSIHYKRFDESPDPINFEPTIIASFGEALKMFERLNSNWGRDTECTNRAHIWAHEEFKTNNISSQKAFVFFTASYINRVHFKWWFHVAPLFSVREGSKIEKRVFDVMFNHHPVTIKEWTDNFVFSKRPCKVTTKFSEYDVNPQTEDCYFITSPMYYWTPTDISNEETQNIFKKEFNQGEIRAAFSEAF